MCVYTLNSEPAGWGRSAAKGGLAEFNFIKTAAAGDPDKGPSFRAPGAGPVTVDEHATPWRVIAATGSARYRHRGRSVAGWQAVSIGLPIEPFAELETGADGRLELFNGHDQITLAPNSVVALPHAVAGVPHIKILQSAGHVNYEVESRRGPTGLLSRIGQMFLSGSRPKGRFEVHTSHLVAAVKGTTFAVEVDEGDAVVDVREGSVLVTANRSGQSAYVMAGQRATVNAGRGDGVSVEGSSTNDDDTGGTIGQGADSQGADSQGDDSQGGDSQGGDSQGGDSQGGDSQGGDSQGGDSQGGDSQGGDSQGGDSQGGDSQGGDSQGGGSQGGNSQGNQQ